MIYILAGLTIWFLSVLAATLVLLASEIFTGGK